MEKINLKIEKHIEEVEKRTSMFILNPNYDRVRNYFTGYFNGISEVIEKDLNKELQDWFTKSATIGRSLVWSEYIYHILAKKSEEQALQIFYAELKNFLRQNTIFSGIC